jgi:hypothetical protein
MQYMTELFPNSTDGNSIPFVFVGSNVYATSGELRMTDHYDLPLPSEMTSDDKSVAVHATLVTSKPGQ